MTHYKNKTVVFTDSKSAVMLLQAENKNFLHDVSEIKIIDLGMR